MASEKLILQLKAMADLFLAIRMDWSDPRYECREGINAAKAAIKDLTGEDYEPVYDEDNDGF